MVDLKTGLVSVVIPTRNRADLLVRAVESVLAQDAAQLEVIVVDDASTDGTPGVLARFSDRIRLIRVQRNIERGAARNLGARSASGELIAFLDSDDQWQPGKLPRQLAIARADAVCVTGINMLDTSGRTVRAGYVPPADASRRIFVENLFLGASSSLLVPRSIFEDVGGFPENWALQGSEDWIFLARIVARRYAIDVVPAALVHYQVHSGNATANPDRVAVSMWSAVEAFQASEHLSADEMRMLRCHTAGLIARGFATRGVFKPALAWGLRAGRYSQGKERIRTYGQVAVSGVAGSLRQVGLRGRI